MGEFLSRSADPDPVIDFPGGNPTLTTPGVARLTAKVNNVPLDLSEARIVWELEGDEPRFGQTASVARSTVGEARVEAEATLPDGRRVFAATSAYFNDPVNGGVPFNPNDPTVTTVALYHFDQFDANGKLPDSKNNHHLTVNGNVTLADNTTWMHSPAGSAVQFGGIGDALKTDTTTIPNNMLRPAGSSGFTIEFRMYIKSLPNSGSALFLFRFAQGQPPGNVSEWSIKYHTQSASLPQIFGPSGQVILDSNGWNTKMTPNTWHRVKITAENFSDFSGLTAVYVDDMITPSAPPQAVSQFLTTDNWILTMGDFVGCVDEVRISKTIR